MRVLLHDPLADDLRRVSLDEADTAVEVAVDVADGLPRRARLRRCPRRGVVVEFNDGTCWVDHSFDPAGAVAKCFGSEIHLAAASSLIRDLAATASRWVQGLPDVLPASRLVFATHPVLRELAAGRPLIAPDALPLAWSEMFAHTDLRRMLAELGAAASVSRPVRSAAVDSLTYSGALRLREVSVFAAMAGLPEPDICRLLAPSPQSHMQQYLSHATAHIAAAPLSRLGRSGHFDVLAGLLARTDGLALLRQIAEAETLGLDTSGIRGGTRLDWLLDRVAEARHVAAGAGPLAELHGCRIGESGTRLRVVRSREEFGHIGTSMSNCLATHGPHYIAGGSVILVVVARDGTALQAIQIRQGRVVQWKAARNRPVSSDQALPVRSMLAEHGIEIPASPPMAVYGLDDEPF